MTKSAPLTIAGTELAGRPKIGRPARIDRAMIARAAYEIGLDRVTMKAVADHLGVSVPGLYHHVQGRDDLMRLGAEYSAAQLHDPGRPRPALVGLAARVGDRTATTPSWPNRRCWASSSTARWASTGW